LDKSEPGLALKILQQIVWGSRKTHQVAFVKDTKLLQMRDYISLANRARLSE
jgi:hypothetical protein